MRGERCGGRKGNAYNIYYNYIWRSVMELRDHAISKKWASRYTGICYMYSDSILFYVFSVYIIILWVENYNI